MKKFSVLGLALVLVLGFSVMAGAAMPTPANIDVNVTVKKHAELTYTDENANNFSSIIASIEKDGTAVLPSGNFNLKCNGPVKATLTSSGFGDNHVLNNYFSYKVAVGGFEKVLKAGGTAVQIPGIPQNSWNGTWKVQFGQSAYNDSEWWKLAAGSNYKDTITVTISE